MNNGIRKEKRKSRERERKRKVVGEGERVPYSGTLSRENEIS